SGEISPGSEGMLAFSASDQVVGDVFDDGEVGRGFSGSHAALVVAHHHVEHPTQGVLDRIGMGTLKISDEGSVRWL
ncbi:MAG: hypothetical protein ACLP1D_17105, partial [Xanthobacteraceae bacterium]